MRRSTFLSAPFADLKKNGKATGQLASELNLAKSVQLEITVKSNSEALKRLQYVLKYQDIKTVADPAIAKPVDNKKSEYLVYADNLTTDELTKLVNELSDSYVVGTGNNEKMVASPYQKVTLTPLGQGEKQKVAKLLGVDAKALERKEAKSEKSDASSCCYPARPAHNPRPRSASSSINAAAPNPGRCRFSSRFARNKSPNAAYVFGIPVSRSQTKFGTRIDYRNPRNTLALLPFPFRIHK